MNGEYIIDSYLDWYFKDDYIYNEVTKQYELVDSVNESEVKDV